jgi:hypothetical protein
MKKETKHHIGLEKACETIIKDIKQRYDENTSQDGFSDLFPQPTAAEKKLDYEHALRKATMLELSQSWFIKMVDKYGVEPVYIGLHRFYKMKNRAP